ncbi:MAG: NnrS family protein [Verrucomicrobiae bacterium]|nr:NnrS family protein [Verrucomicrobiae bacterium]
MADIASSPEVRDRPLRPSWSEVCAEPFRLLFPAAAVAGTIGVLMWPLHFAGWLDWYPGAGHPRIMAQGFFGGFIAGFLATALPRVLGVAALRPWETLPLVLLQAAMVACWFVGWIRAGDVLFLAFLAGLAGPLLRRMPARRDLPPPGFLLVAMGLVCAVGGGFLALGLDPVDSSPVLVRWHHLLSYQGFLLLPVAGVSPFLLPRFLHQLQREEFAESRRPPPGWWAAAGRAAAVGLLILVSFAMEAQGWPRTGALIRAVTLAAWLAHEVPWARARVRGPMAGVLRMSLFLVPAGLLFRVLPPSHPVALLHVTLMGGLGLLTLTVATRVVLGHSGQMARLQGPNRWFWSVAILVLLAVVTRVSADLWPRIQASHYIHAALLWTAALLWWGFRVLPGVFRMDPGQ